jgi:hypothetical protein
MNISVFNLVSGASPKTEPNLSTNLFEEQNKKHKLDTSISKTPDTTISAFTIMWTNVNLWMQKFVV